MSWGYILGVAIEVELKKMRERERGNESSITPRFLFQIIGDGGNPSVK